MRTLTLLAALAIVLIAPLAAEAGIFFRRGCSSCGSRVSAVQSRAVVRVRSSGGCANGVCPVNR